MAGRQQEEGEGSGIDVLFQHHIDHGSQERAKERPHPVLSRLYVSHIINTRGAMCVKGAKNKGGGINLRSIEYRTESLRLRQGRKNARCLCQRP